MELEFSEKQLEYIRNATHRWNGKVGATQCGKTYIDISVMIYDRMRDIRGKSGLRVILGVSKGTIERNVLNPMRDFWGADMVGEIKSDNTAIIFGEEVYCLGAEKVSQVSKLRGARIAYCYCDEAVDYNEEVWQLLKSRLSLPYSKCDFTGNPASPTHFIKKFIDTEGLDVYAQAWTLFDNPFLPQSYVDALCKEYEGTIYYDRYVMGQWKRAEGAIYRKLADNPQNYVIKQLPPRFMLMEAGIDFGGNKSKTTFVLSGLTYNFQTVIAIDAKRIEKNLSPDELNIEFVNWFQKVYDKYGKMTQSGFFYCNFDNAEPVLARGLTTTAIRNNLRTTLRGALKTPVNNRIRLINVLIGAGRYFIYDGGKDYNALNVLKSLQEAVYDSKEQNDTRLDNGTSDIDTLDGMEYSIERYTNDLMNAALYDATKKPKKQDGGEEA